MMSSFVYKQYILIDVVSVVIEQNYSTCKGNEAKNIKLVWIIIPIRKLQSF